MNRENSRKYVSPSRERQATATRNRIMDAAEALLLEKGFAGMTIAAVAEKAAVSQQRVYSIFASKAGIIAAALEDRILNDERNIDAIRQLHATDDPIFMLQSIARLLGYIYESTAPTFTAIYGASVVSPQIAQLEAELNQNRWAKQEPLADGLFKSGKLQPHLSRENVRDVLWALTGRELYMLFVIRRGWNTERYTQQLYAMLVGSLVNLETIEKHRAAGTLSMQAAHPAPL